MVNRIKSEEEKRIDNIFDKIRSRIKTTKAVIMTMPFGEGVIYQRWKEFHLPCSLKS